VEGPGDAAMKLLRSLIPIVRIRVAQKHTQLGEDKGSTRHSIESCNRKIR